MHNFAVTWLQISTLILPENTGMNMKEALLRVVAEFPMSFPGLRYQSSQHLLLTTQVVLPFVPAQSHLKIAF